MSKTLIDMALPYQREFILAKKRKKIAIMARQTGKSWMLSLLAVYKALSKKNGLSLIISTGARAAAEIMSKVEQFAEAVQVMSGGKLKFDSKADCIKFNTGSRVMSLPSGNPAALRGYTAVATIIDEAAYIERPDKVMAAILPTLTRDPDAELIVASTPAGKNCYFYDQWNKALADDAWHAQKVDIYQAARAGLAVDIDALRQLCPDNDIFAMEYECQFIDQYSSFLDRSLLQFADQMPEGLQAAWMGMDVGATSDRTAIADVARDKDSNFWVRDIVMMHKAEYQSQLDILKQLHREKKWHGGYIDANGIGNPIAEFAGKQVSAKIKGFNWTSASKTPAYENMRALVFDRKLFFAEHLRSLIEDDIANVSRLVNEAGVIKYAAGRNQNGHSDSVSALVLALQAAKDMPLSAARPIAYMHRSVFS